MQIALSDLKLHPRNSEVYGDCDSDNCADIIESMGKFGQFQPVLVNKDMVIISGHRRHFAAHILGWDTIECVIREDAGEADDMRDLILANQHRIKTNEVLIREGQILLEYEKTMANLRRGHAGKGEGSARDAVGQKLGMSGANFVKGLGVVKEIDALKETNPEKAEALRKKLNKSIDAGARAMAEDENDPNRLWWPDLEGIILRIERGHDKLSKTRNHTTPKALGHMIGNLKEFAIRLRTWDPSTPNPCPACNGQGTIQIEGQEPEKCEMCLNGHAGLYRESQY